MLMTGTSKTDHKTDAQRRFEGLLAKTEAHLQEKASLESEGRKQNNFPKKSVKDRVTD